MHTYATRPGPNDSTRFRWVHDEYHETRGSYAYDTEEETRAAEDEELANLESGRWVVLGCIVQHRCGECGQWRDGDSLWGIVTEASEAELAQFEAEMNLMPPKHV